MTREAALALESGSIFLGQHFGAETETDAELVFNTSMTGYLEVCTDPSYRGQMVAMCHPQIGNYGVAASHRESSRPWLAALIVRELAERHHHWEAQGDLASYLADFGVPGVQGLDTRALVRQLRSRGTMRAVLRLSGPDGFDSSRLDRLRSEAGSAAYLSDKAVVGEVSGALDAGEGEAGAAPRVTLIDYGIKQNIVHSLARRGLKTIVLPWTATAEDVLATNPSGVVLSNGPGDPATLQDAVRTTTRLAQSGLPLFGICLGHQLLGLSVGARTSRLGYGHHGGNHPVKEVATGRVSITTQNHEFQVEDGPALAGAGFKVSHLNLNDGSIEGLAHVEQPVFSVQYHPEGCPGPQDNQELFDRFAALVRATTRADAPGRSGDQPQHHTGGTP
jgi:carbamoyl-phosphate synthase small subunit